MRLDLLSMNVRKNFNPLSELVLNGPHTSVCTSCNSSFVRFLDSVETASREFCSSYTSYMSPCLKNLLYPFQSPVSFSKLPLHLCNSGVHIFCATVTVRLNCRETFVATLAQIQVAGSRNTNTSCRLSGHILLALYNI